VYDVAVTAAAAVLQLAAASNLNSTRYVKLPAAPGTAGAPHVSTALRLAGVTVKFCGALGSRAGITADAVLLAELAPFVLLANTR
jgi:hypothetical protein